MLDSVGVADIKAGRIDPRVIGVLTKLSQEHKITVSCMCSDHSKFTAGGSVSNHHFGRGADIAAIDGEIVGPGSPLAREVASELSSLNPDIRPNEIGSPFAINGAGYFTDAAHQNHLHIGFKQEIPADWKPPADVAASVPAAAPVAAAAAVPGAPAAAAAAPEVRKGSQMFLKAVTAQAADVHAKRVAGNDSLAFLKAVEPPKASAAAVDPAAAAPAAAPVDPAAAGQPAAAAVDAAAVAAAAPDAYPGDDAPREQVAAWMAGQAQKRGLPPQLPLMASLVESGMKNLNFGDADSVGFFQMRVGIWNQGAYAGYPEKPELQVKWFLDQAEAVKRQRLVSGKSITDPNQFGDWIADVERPAAQYRGRYQTKLDEANGLLQSSAPPAAAAGVPVAAVPIDPAAAAASAAAVGDAKLPAEILAPVQEAIAAGNAPGPKALAAIEEASKYIGTRLQVGRLDAADGLRLLGPDAVGVRAVGRADPARHLHADRGGERDRGRPLAPEAGRPRVLRRQRRRPPRRDVPRRRQVPARPAHRRRREGLKPRRALLRPAVRGRSPLRPGRRRRRSRGRRGSGGGTRGGVRRGRGRRLPPSTRPRSPGRRPPSPATRPRSAATTRSSSRRSRPPRRARNGRRTVR